MCNKSKGSDLWSAHCNFNGLFWRMHVTDTQLLLTNVFEVTKLTENHTLTLLDKLLNN